MWVVWYCDRGSGEFVNIGPKSRQNCAKNGEKSLIQSTFFCPSWCKLQFQICSWKNEKRGLEINITKWCIKALTSLWTSARSLPHRSDRHQQVWVWWWIWVLHPSPPHHRWHEESPNSSRASRTSTTARSNRNLQVCATSIHPVPSTGHGSLSKRECWMVEGCMNGFYCFTSMSSFSEYLLEGALIWAEGNLLFFLQLSLVGFCILPTTPFI